MTWADFIWCSSTLYTLVPETLVRPTASSAAAINYTSLIHSLTNLIMCIICVCKACTAVSCVLLPVQGAVLLLCRLVCIFRKVCVALFTAIGLSGKILLHNQNCFGSYSWLVTVLHIILRVKSSSRSPRKVSRSHFCLILSYFVPAVPLWVASRLDGMSISRKLKTTIEVCIASLTNFG